MSREQKPESAEFRTREAQLADLSGRCSNFKPTAEAHLIEAEARGAAEQRRKDEASLYYYEVLSGCVWVRCEKDDYLRAKTVDSNSARVSSYTPNVAALEGRVKELEGEIARLKNSEWYINQNEEAAGFDIATIMEGADLWEIKEVEGCRIVEKAWAFVDYYGHIHKFPTKAAAKSAVEAICAWAESLKRDKKND